MSRGLIYIRRNALNRKLFPSEMWFKKHLDFYKIKGFRRNVCLIDRFFGDFVFKQRKLVIEIDGRSHDNKADYDKSRDTLLGYFGYKVIRVHHKNFKELNAAIQFILGGKKIVPIKAGDIERKKNLVKQRNLEKIKQYEAEKLRHQQIIEARKNAPKHILRKRAAA